jgi:hypothetical protein
VGGYSSDPVRSIAPNSMCSGLSADVDAPEVDEPFAGRGAGDVPEPHECCLVSPVGVPAAGGGAGAREGVYSGGAGGKPLRAGMAPPSRLVLMVKTCMFQKWLPAITQRKYSPLRSELSNLSWTFLLSEYGTLTIPFSASTPSTGSLGRKLYGSSVAVLAETMPTSRRLSAAAGGAAPPPPGPKTNKVRRILEEHVCRLRIKPEVDLNDHLPLHPGTEVARPPRHGGAHQLLRSARAAVGRSARGGGRGRPSAPRSDRRDGRLGRDGLLSQEG